MHELSVAHAVVSTVIEALPTPAPRVTQVRLRIGELSGIVPQALEFAYDVAAEGTPLADAALVIERSPIVIRCTTCGEVELPSARSFRCPSCGEPSGDVVSGKELEIVDITLEEPELAEVGP
jgi:hydrogenase nickel incorporation protein HypA/HybF